MDGLFILRCIALLALIAISVWTIYQMIVAADRDDEHLCGSELLILSILHDAAPAELPGLDLVKRCDALLQNSVIYLHLARLETRGLVHRRCHIGRSLYRLTERGRRAIRPFHVDRESTVAEDCQ